MQTIFVSPYSSRHTEADLRLFMRIKKGKDLNNMMKRVLSAFLASLMALCLVACGNTADTPSADDPSSGEAGTSAWKPSGTIDFVCPYSAGGGSDVCARTIASVMKDGGYCGSANPVVQNLSGGGGLVGTSYVFGKAGDDMTLCTYAPGQLGAAIANNSECGWDALTQLCILALEEQTIVTQPGMFEDLQDLIDYSKEHPGEVVIAGTTLGNEDHMCVEMLNKKAGADITYVTYDSAGDIMTAILGGHITGGICNPSECNAQVISGDVDCLASFGENDINYISGFEEVPTVMSYGYDINFVMFRGMAGAPDMSSEAKEFWVEALRKVSEDPAWTEDYVASKGLTPTFIAGDELTEFLQNQYDLYYNLQKEIGLI